MHGRNIPAIILTDTLIDATYAYDYEINDVIRYPYTAYRLEKALDALRKKKNSNELIPSYSETISLHILKEVLFIESQNRNVIVHTETGNFETKIPIKVYENYLRTHGFVMTHRSYLVNMEKIQSIEGNEIYFANHHSRALIAENTIHQIQSLWTSYYSIFKLRQNSPC